MTGKRRPRPGEGRPRLADGLAKNRMFRAADEIYLAAQLEAARRGEPLAEALRRFLVDYAARRDLREN